MQFIKGSIWPSCRAWANLLEHALTQSRPTVGSHLAAAYAMLCLSNPRSLLSSGLAQQVEDEEGFQGVKLSRDLVKVAGQALTANLSALGRTCLPVTEKAKFAWTQFQRKVCTQAVGEGHRVLLLSSTA